MDLVFVYMYLCLNKSRPWVFLNCLAATPPPPSLSRKTYSQMGKGLWSVERKGKELLLWRCSGSGSANGSLAFWLQGSASGPITLFLLVDPKARSGSGSFLYVCATFFFFIIGKELAMTMENSLIFKNVYIVSKYICV
jgi:hypothetical protein